jgi:hypothetical protein
VAPATRLGPRPWAGGIRHGLPRHRRGRTGGGRTVCPPSHRPFPPARQRLPPADGHPSRTRKPRRGHAGLRPRRHDATRGTRTRTRSGDPEGARPPAGPGHERTLNPRGTGLHGAGPSERACFRFSTSARDRITVIQTTGTDPKPSAPSECSFSTRPALLVRKFSSDPADGWGRRTPAVPPVRDRPRSSEHVSRSAGAVSV